MLYSRSGLVSALLAALGALARAAIPEHLVQSLPGYEGQLPSNHYSGYIGVGELTQVKGQLHYWLIESENDPANDPVVLWLNGGPGSSSLIGLLTENGQIKTGDSSFEQTTEDGVPKVFYNPYGWTTKANMIFLESPKGVGFSHCEGVESSRDCVNTDESTAQDAYEFLVNFFAAYPEYKKNDFYITGESYAGIYIPMMMDQIDQDPLGAKINLKGAAIGNGCWGNDVGTCAFYSPEYFHIKTMFLFGHGMISQTMYQDVLKACRNFESLNVRCVEKMTEVAEQAGAYNIYNIYDRCGRDQVASERKTPFPELLKRLSERDFIVESRDSLRSLHPGVGEALNDYECGAETAMDAWLAEPSVIEALHVLPDTPGMRYKKTVSDLRPLYADLFKKYRMLIYAGDTDGCVPYVGIEAWTRELGFNVTKEWHSWFGKPDFEHSLHKAGYAIEYDSFEYITVNGAGHMVPTYQPGYALSMFTKFLNNERF